MNKIIVKSVPESCNMLARLNENLAYDCYKRVSNEEFEYLYTVDHRTFSISLDILARQRFNIIELIRIEGKITLPQLRERTGLSLKEAALSGGIDPRTLKKWELDCSRVDAYKLYGLVRNVYGCPMELLHIGQAQEQQVI